MALCQKLCVMVSMTTAMASSMRVATMTMMAIAMQRCLLWEIRMYALMAKATAMIRIPEFIREQWIFREIR
jgi:hypothetical protein